MIRLLVEQDYATVLICTFTILFILTNQSFEKKITRLFLMATWTVLGLVLADGIELWASTWPYPSLIRKLTSAFGYSLRPAIAYWIIVILKRNQENENRLLAIPLIINILTSFSTCFSDIVFTYTKDNVFTRGPLGYLPFIVSGFYIVTMMSCTVKKYKDGNRAESFIAIAIAMMSIFATLMEAALKYDGFLNVTCAISIIFYYLYLHTQKYKRDTLTNVLDRRSFYLDCQKLLSSSFIIASIDLNHLKQINDTRGHGAGDVAICTMVECIRKNLYNGCTLYRTGGDEFMMICIKQSKAAVEKMLIQIRQDMDKTPYSCAIGIANYCAGSDFDKVCGEADAAMYTNKSEMKATRPVEILSQKAMC